MMISTKKQGIFALIYLLIAAILGFFLRLHPLADIPVNYRYVLHAHSHIALLGWVYLAITAILYHVYLRENHSIHKTYLNLYVFTQITLIGMLISFPIQGYGLVSIIFSTLFLFASYWFYGLFMRHTKVKQSFPQSLKLIRSGLFYLLLSSVGPWSLGIIMNTLGNESIWYKISIYFYLHFLYNGWFVVTIFAFFIFLLEKNKKSLSGIQFRNVYYLVHTSVILSFFLSVLFTMPHFSLYILGGLGVLLQVFILYYLFKSKDQVFTIEKLNVNRSQGSLLLCILFILIIKIGLQILTSIPYFADIAYLLQDLIIGYLHLVFLGLISLSLFFFLAEFKLIRISAKQYHIYIIILILTELLIFTRGLLPWLGLSIPKHYNLILCVVSGLFIFIVFSILYTAILPAKKNH